MSNHPPLDKTLLIADVELEIKKTKALRRCPKCGGELGPALCAGGAFVPSWKDDRTSDDTQHCFKSCPSCLIVWELMVSNSIDESNSGMIQEVGYEMWLHAYANCACRTPLLTVEASGKSYDRGVRLAKSVTEHARLGY